MKPMRARFPLSSRSMMLESRNTIGKAHSFTWVGMYAHPSLRLNGFTKLQPLADIPLESDPNSLTKTRRNIVDVAKGALSMIDMLTRSFMTKITKKYMVFTFT